MTTRRRKKPTAPRVDVDFSAVALKGVVEQGTPGAYFGSWHALRHYCEQAAQRGWLAQSGTTYVATDAGRRVYETSGLADLPRAGRGYMWDWSGVRLDAAR